MTLKKDVPIERFCSHDVVQVTESDIRAVQFKPAGKRDVVVTLKGVHPNTRDDGVMNYLSKFEKNYIKQGGKTCIWGWAFKRCM